MEIEKLVKKALRDGKVIIGFEKTKKLLKTSKDIKTVVVASNIPDTMLKELEYYAKLRDIEILKFGGSNIELGNICGKPFNISVIGILKG